MNLDLVIAYSFSLYDGVDSVGSVSFLCGLVQGLKNGQINDGCSLLIMRSLL